MKFHRVLVGGWILIAGSILALALFPQLVVQFPRSRYIRPIMGLFIVITFLCVIAKVYRDGLKRSRDN
jgi:hypothetical protein